MAGGPRKSFVALVLIACASVAVFRILQRPDPAAVELRIQELVRVHGGQDILVLRETSGLRRLAVPVSRAEAAQIERALRPGSRPDSSQDPHGAVGLGPRTVEALSGRVLRASIDEVSRQGGFRAHLALGSGAREILLDAAAGEALSLAVQAGAPIVASPAILDEAGVSPDDLHGRTARELRSDRTPAPVLPI